MPLTAAKREKLERRLLEERKRALSALGRSVDTHSSDDEQDRSGDLTKVPFHMADRGTDTMDEELDASNSTRISNELAEIDAALERLYKTPEEFGICADTREEIPFERLEIIPWARTCGDAEERRP